METVPPVQALGAEYPARLVALTGAHPPVKENPAIQALKALSMTVWFWQAGWLLTGGQETVRAGACGTVKEEEQVALWPQASVAL